MDYKRHAFQRKIYIGLEYEWKTRIRLEDQNEMEEGLWGYNELNHEERIVVVNISSPSRQRVIVDSRGGLPSSAQRNREECNASIVGGHGASMLKHLDHNSSK